ncbi:MAG: copper amine oxidase N-terminal domain-containing protein [Clostridia bacterium]|nr:copper amine oxidase N-terminal domain-containing protein [Clostridia bacterium]
MQTMKRIRFLSLCMAFMLLFGMLAFAEDADVYTMEQKEITVTYNGKDIKFDDAHPMTQSDRTMVPLRAAMEQIGCEVGFDKGEITIFRDDKKIQLFLGSKEVTVSDDDVTNTYTMDVEPLVVNDRALVPIRFIAEALDCKVNWNASGKEAVIIDVAAWKKEMKEVAPLMDALMSLPSPGKTSSTYQFSGTYTMKYNAKNDPELAKDINFTTKITLAGKVFTSDGKMSANLTLGVNFDQFIDYINQTDDIELKTFLKQLQRLKSMTFDLVFDEEFNLYISGSGLSTLGNAFGIEPLKNQSQAVRIPVGALISDATGLPLSEMIHSESIWAGIEKAVNEDDHMFTRTVKAINDFLAALAVRGKTTVRKTLNEQNYYWTMDDCYDAKTEIGNTIFEFDVDATQNVNIRNGNIMMYNSTSKQKTTENNSSSSLNSENKWNFQCTRLNANKVRITIPTKVIDWMELIG